LTCLVIIASMCLGATKTTHCFAPSITKTSFRLFIPKTNTVFLQQQDLSIAILHKMQQESSGGGDGRKYHELFWSLLTRKNFITSFHEAMKTKHLFAWLQALFLSCLSLLHDTCITFHSSEEVAIFYLLMFWLLYCVMKIMKLFFDKWSFLRTPKHVSYRQL